MKNFLGWVSGLLSFTAALTLTAVAAPGDLPDAIWDTANPRVQEVIKVQESITADLMALDGILGTAVGEDGAGGVAMVVYVNDENANKGEIMRALPHGIRGVRVVGELTDTFRAMAKPAAGTRVSHTAKQTPPIKLGTSGGWGYDLANGYCCGGTLGSLVQIGGDKFIMSNYHVFESDIVSGGNNLIATDGSPVIQPGLIDVGCNIANAQSVATLVVMGSLPGSNVDVSVAKVRPGMVDASGAILEIGSISKATVAASLRQAVKKSGRTTGLTTSTVSGLNATISVQYENECAGGVAFTKTFTRQIVVSNLGSRFLNSGDSGSLMVENVSNKPPRAVGLLYAGSSTSAIANPIGQVLDFVGKKLGAAATMVGQ
jgi:hypothetical protein